MRERCFFKLWDHLDNMKKLDLRSTKKRVNSRKKKKKQKLKKEEKTGKKKEKKRKKGKKTGKNDMNHYKESPNVELHPHKVKALS